MTYDVFLSYRRDGGEYTARILRDRLEDMGYRVFFDVESLRAGDFNVKLYSVIEECKDFIIVLSPGGLDRCANEGDWVRLEIAHALKNGRNIVPVMLRGFSFPDALPEDIDALRYKNALEANSEFFDAFIAKLKTFLTAKPGPLRRIAQNKAVRRALPMFALALLIGLGSLAAYLTFGLGGGKYPSTDSEKNLCGEVIDYVLANNMLADEIAVNLSNAIETTRRTLDEKKEDDGTAAFYLDAVRQSIEAVDVSAAAPGEALLSKLDDSPFSKGDIVKLNEFVALIKADALNAVTDLGNLINPAFAYSEQRLSRTMSFRQAMYEYQTKDVVLRTNLILLPIRKSYQKREDFLQYVAPNLVRLPYQGYSWTTSEKEIGARMEKSANELEVAAGDLILALSEAP